MTGDPGKMSCEEFQAQLPELIGSGEDVSAHPHLQSCDRCRALLAELETIAEAARQLFPSVEPPDEVWEQIESALKREGNLRAASSDRSRAERGSFRGESRFRSLSRSLQPIDPSNGCAHARFRRR